MCVLNEVALSSRKESVSFVGVPTPLKYALLPDLHWLAIVSMASCRRRQDVKIPLTEIAMSDPGAKSTESDGTI